MTNFERWRYYTKDLTSPDSFIDFGFYYMIAAGLQRRVWTGPDHQKLYPNIYVILVGEPGVGKGLVIRPVSDMLKFHKLEDPKEQDDPAVISVSPELIQAINHANWAEATDGRKRSKIDLEKPLLFPLAADATTYEALIRSMAKATRRINYKEWNEKLQRYIVQIYTHSSLAFCLEEISSLFRRHTEDVVNFLLKAYDCGDYEYDTKTQGNDRVRRCCLNFFGGTTPGFMQSTFNDRLLNEGFSSRAWFIFEHTNRFNTLMKPELNSEQIECFKELTAHIHKLSKLYGRVGFEPDAWAYLEDWWQNVHPVSRPNTSLKLVPYYARKNIHVQKLAMILHFGEDAEQDEHGFPKNKISLACTQKAMEILDKQERKMHYAINFDNKNPLSAVGRKILQYLKSFGPQTANELLLEFWDDARKAELDEILTHLMMMQKIALFDVDVNGKKIRKYDLLVRREGDEHLKERVSF